MTTRKPSSPRWMVERANLGYLCRFKADDTAAIANARRRLRVARAEQYLADLIHGSPRLTADDLRRLGAFLTTAAV